MHIAPISIIESAFMERMCARRFTILPLALALGSCGIAEDTRDGPGDGGSGNGESGDGNSDSPADDAPPEVGEVSSENGYTGCFTTFGLEPARALAELSASERQLVCTTQEAMFYCINPQDQLYLYEAALLSLSASDAPSVCREFYDDFQTGELMSDVQFACRTFEPLGCGGTVGDLETCFRDYLQGIEDRPTPEWSCDNGDAIIAWTLLQATDLPASCAPFDGCAL
jgi:hypothetical protein